MAVISDGQYIGPFIGFSPVEDPKFVVLVVIDDLPKEVPIMVAKL